MVTHVAIGRCWARGFNSHSQCTTKASRDPDEIGLCDDHLEQFRSGEREAPTMRPPLPDTPTASAANPYTAWIGSLR